MNIYYLTNNSARLFLLGEELKFQGHVLCPTEHSHWKQELIPFKQLLESSTWEEDYPQVSHGSANAVFQILKTQEIELFVIDHLLFPDIHKNGEDMYACINRAYDPFNAEMTWDAPPVIYLINARVRFMRLHAKMKTIRIAPGFQMTELASDISSAIQVLRHPDPTTQWLAANL